MIIKAILVVISVTAALVYLVRYQMSPPSRWRTLVKVSAVGALTAAAIVDLAPLTLIFFLATAAIGDAFLAREDEDGFYIAMVTELLSHIFLCLTLYSAWTGVDEPFAAAIGLLGIWVGYFMLIWGGMHRAKVIVICYSVGVLAATYLALGTTTYGQFAVVGMLSYILAQILLSLHYFLLVSGRPETQLAGHMIWVAYYAALLMFFVAFTV